MNYIVTPNIINSYVDLVEDGASLTGSKSTHLKKIKNRTKIGERSNWFPHFSV